MIRYDPSERGFGEFFVYASCHWLKHYGKIETVSLLSVESIEKICEAGSTRLRNWIEQNRRPSCAVKPRFEFDSSLYDPLGITSLYGSEPMLIHLLRSADFARDMSCPTTLRSVDRRTLSCEISQILHNTFEDRSLLRRDRNKIVGRPDRY